MDNTRPGYDSRWRGVHNCVLGCDYRRRGRKYGVFSEATRKPSPLFFSMGVVLFGYLARTPDNRMLSAVIGFGLVASTSARPVDHRWLPDTLTNLDQNTARKKVTIGQLREWINSMSKAADKDMEAKVQKLVSESTRQGSSLDSAHEKISQVQEDAKKLAEAADARIDSVTNLTESKLAALSKKDENHNVRLENHTARIEATEDTVFQFMKDVLAGNAKAVGYIIAIALGVAGLATLWVLVIYKHRDLTLKSRLLSLGFQHMKY